VAVVGITDFAQSQLGEIVFVDVATEGETLAQDDVFGAIEAVKIASDLLMPLSGEIVEFNQALSGSPELVNKDPYGEGWLIKIRMSEPSRADSLLDADGYKGLTG
jgi:glycine cleavage system H protein